MSANEDDFRRGFVEFLDMDKFPNPVIVMYLDLAYKLLNASRWGEVLDYGAMLFTAHNLVLEARAMRDSGTGAIVAGPVNSKSVNGVTVSYDSSSGIEEKAGHWNDTSYGRRFIRLARMMGAGPITTAPGSSPLGEFDGAWPGPGPSYW